ncbi:type I methionyl aminopeptidase [Pollutibacter soli]|uniref:type I methionyl aminopeptidase n=1 Tax=Pollutibacter soli TaxID=3034157 RepID=UPI003013F553
MSITSDLELTGMQKVSDAVAETLRQMREYAQPGMNTAELDAFGGKLLTAFGAKSAPRETYGFPGWTCISLNHEIAHGIPSSNKIMQEGDLVNIDVSAELNGFWSDNGGSFVLGKDVKGHLALVEASKKILNLAISQIKGGVKIAEIGKLIEKEAAKKGYRVIRNLVGHGVGRSLHEEPTEIPNYYDRTLKTRFRKNTTVAIETFISTGAGYAKDAGDGWTFITGDSSYVAQHEHTILVTEQEALILTAANGI